MGNIRLIATDIDGTILPFGKNELPPRTLDILRAALRRGIRVVPVSGRLYSSLPRELVEMQGLEYVVCSNGAVVTDLREARAVYERKIPAEETAEILEYLGTQDVYSCVYIEGNPYNRAKLHPGLAIHYSYRLEFFSRNPREDLPAFVRQLGKPAEKIFVAVFDSGVREKIRKELECFPGIRSTTSSRWNLEINHREANKGNALAWLCGHLGIAAEEVIAMGDNENDLPMLAFAGTAVVPAGGEKAARDLASAVVPPCEMGGPALYLEQQLQLSEDRTDR